MIRFPKSISIAAGEKALSEISKSAPENALLLPVDTSHYSFGGLATAIQAIITWGRRSDNRVLLIRKADVVRRIEKDDDGEIISEESIQDAHARVQRDQLDELTSRPHKFAAIMFAKRITFNIEPDQDIRPILNLNAKAAIDLQERNSFGQRYGGLCWFAFVDHSSKGFDRNFYRDREPRQPAQISEIIRAMVERSSIFNSTKSLDKNQLECLGRIFYELFLNTHEHGTRAKRRSEWLKPGIRIIYTNAINLSEAGKKNIIKDEPVLARYLDAAEIQSRSRFIEISIIDSGLGYCNRWRADHPALDFEQQLTLPQEYEILKTCFHFRKTSTGVDSKGHGLPVVMDRLTKLKGFIRVRSGRLALFRNFIDSPYMDLESEFCEFTDWATQKAAQTDVTAMAEVAGTAITLLIPLETLS